MIQSVKNFVFGNRYNYWKPFVATFDTRNVTVTGNPTNQLFIPISTLNVDGNVAFLTFWGDGTYSLAKTVAEQNTPKTYAVPGIYEVAVYVLKGKIFNPIFNGSTERLKILNIKKFGDFLLQANTFNGCTNLDLSGVEDVGVTNTNDMSNVFSQTRFYTFNNLSNWVFNGNRITSIFINNINFNQPMTLNAPNATRFADILRGCTSFNSDIIINAPNAREIFGFFRGCTAFNKDVSNIGFNWSIVTDMSNFMTGKTSANYNASYYDNLLIALDNGGKTGVTLGMGTIKYTSAGATARANLIAKSWTITDGGII